VATKKPATVAEYLAALPPERRTAIEAVRKEINRRLPKGYAEGIQYGMIGWHVPHSIHPAGYHCDPKQPLPFACLASQKASMSLHLMSLYLDPPSSKRFTEAWKAAGKRLDMGKACVRFKRLEDVPLDVIGDAVARVPVAAYVKMHEANLAKSAPGKQAGKK
jgi:hypothetical protein